MNLLSETKEEQSREKVSSHDKFLAESDIGSRSCFAFANSFDDTALLIHPTFSGKSGAHAESF